jgi:hypothetical protein
LIRKAKATNVMQLEENHDEEEDPSRVEFMANGLRKLGLDCSKGGGIPLLTRCSEKCIELWVSEEFDIYDIHIPQWQARSGRAFSYITGPQHIQETPTGLLTILVSTFTDALAYRRYKSRETNLYASSSPPKQLHFPNLPWNELINCHKVATTTQ